MLLPDHAQQPHGGHHFTDPTGLVLRSPTLRGLLTAIKAYRTANGLPPGSPEAEVEAAYAVQYPWMVSKVNPAATAQEDPIARWLNRIWKAPPRPSEFVESETERVRLGTCSICPHYDPGYAMSSDSRRRLLILGAGRVNNEAACKVQHWAVGLAVLMPKPEAREVEGCWAESCRAST